MNMLSGAGEFIKKNRDDIILALGVILISLLSFAIGYLVAKYQQKEPLKFETLGLITFPFHYFSIVWYL